MSVRDDEFDYDKIVEEYNLFMEQSLGKDNEKFAQYKVQLLKSVIDPKSVNTILNYGCGIGRDMDLLMEYYSDGQSSLYGCDISNESIQYAAKHTHYPDKIHWFHSESPNSIYGQGIKWDLVFVACVLHHINPDDRKIWIKAIADNVTEGGYICVFEHNMKNPMTNKIVKHPKIDAQDNPKWMLKKKEIEDLLLSIDDSFRVYWSGYTLFSPVRASWITNIEKTMKWCPLGAQQCVIVKKEKKVQL